MAERRIEERRREFNEGEEARTPITIIPTTRALEDRQVTQLREGLSRAVREIAGLQEYFRGIRIPPTERTAQDLSAEADRVDQALARMAIITNPVLGERYRDEIELIGRNVADARTAAREGRIGQAVELLDKVNAQIGLLGTVF